MNDVFLSDYMYPRISFSTHIPSQLELNFHISRIVIDIRIESVNMVYTIKVTVEFITGWKDQFLYYYTSSNVYL